MCGQSRGSRSEVVRSDRRSAQVGQVGWNSFLGDRAREKSFWRSERMFFPTTGGGGGGAD